MTHVAAVTRQDAFRARENSGNEATPTWIALANTNWSQDVDTSFRVRFVIQEVANATNPESINSLLQFSLNGGAYTTIDGTTAVKYAAFIGATDGNPTTQQLGSGTFVAGEIDDNGVTASVNLQNSETEMEFCITIDSTLVANGDIVTLEVFNNNLALDQYGQIPSITVVEAAAGTTITGVTYTDSDIYGAGAVLSPGPLQTITGVIFTDPDQFGVGVVASPGPLQAITGVPFADPDIFGGGAVSSLAPAFLRPDADDSNNGWINELGQTTGLWASVDESVASDSDFIKSPQNPSGQILRLRLSDPTSGVDPAQAQSLNYRYGKDFDEQALNVTVRLVQGVSTVIASWDHLGVAVGYVTAQQSLTAPQIAAITDYADLFVEIESTAV